MWRFPWLSSLTDRAGFKQKRAEQTYAAESILKLPDYAKQYKMVEIVLEKLFKVLYLIHYMYGLHN